MLEIGLPGKGANSKSFSSRVFEQNVLKLNKALNIFIYCFVYISCNENIYYLVTFKHHAVYMLIT